MFRNLCVQRSGQQIAREIIAGNNLLNIVRPLQVDREAPRFGNAVGDGSGDQRPSDRAVGGRLTTDLAYAGRIVVVAAEAQRKALGRLRFHSALPDTVDFLVAQKVIQRRRSASVNNVALSEKALVAESAKDREALVERIRQGDGIGANVALVVGVNQLAVADVKFVIDRELCDGMNFHHCAAADLGVGSNRGVGIAIVDAVQVASNAEHLGRLVADADFRPSRFD